MLPSKKQNLDRFEKMYSVTEVFSWIDQNIEFLSNNKPNEKTKAIIDGHLMKVYSQRYHLFQTKGVTCSCCGIIGDRFYKERNFTVSKQPTDINGQYHFNLYGIDSEGDEVLMTKDHIIPITKGGQNTLENYQTMCTVCNGLKAAMSCDEWKQFQKDTSMKTYSKEASLHRYKSLKIIADREGKKIYKCKSLNKIFIATDLENAKSKYTNHEHNVIEYIVEGE